VNALRLATIRAVLGGVFMLFGIAIGVEILLRPEPFKQKPIGLAFAVVLIALGFVRVRAYLKLKSEAGP
jgi:uncharacterized membrane protein